MQNYGVEATRDAATTGHSRRGLLKMLAGAAGGLAGLECLRHAGRRPWAAPVRAAEQNSGLTFTLLGTGSPIPSLERRGPSQLIQVGNDLVLIDAGAGALYRLLESGWRGSGLRMIALTHLHSDHITGLADILWAGWVSLLWDTPPPVVGPPGTQEYITRLIDAYSYDITVRAGDLRREWLVPRVEEVEEGWATEGDGWRLSAFRVEHEPVDQAFGYRLDSDAGSVVVSGDTTYSENLIRHAQGADLLVHEAYWKTGVDRQIAATTDPVRLAGLHTLAGYHTPSTEVGKVAAQAEVGHLVLGHLITSGGAPADLMADVQPDFRRQLTVGADLQKFTLP